MPRPAISWERHGASQASAAIFIKCAHSALCGTVELFDPVHLEERGMEDVKSERRPGSFRILNDHAQRVQVIISSSAITEDLGGDGQARHMLEGHDSTWVPYDLACQPIGIGACSDDAGAIPASG